MLNFLTVLVGSSLGAGFNLYLTLLAIGIYARVGAASESLQAIIEPFGSWWVLVPAGVLFLCEFIADKVPAFDNVWDVAHTVVRPLGAVFIALTLAEDYGVAAQIFAALSGGGLAFGSHAIKAGVRAIARLNPEPTSNAASSTVLSLGEDVVALIVVVTSMVSPYVAAAALVGLLALMLWFGPRLVSLFFFATHATWSRIASIVSRKGGREGPLQPIAPLFLDFAFKKIGRFEPLATSGCYVKLSGLVNYRRGALLLRDDELFLVYRRFMMRRIRRIPLGEIEQVAHRQRWFREMLTVTWEKEKVHLYFVRSDAGYVKDFGDLLATLGVKVTSSNGTEVATAAMPQPA